MFKYAYRPTRFAEAVKECDGVCLIALSVIERHGHHLPLGTDMYIGREMLTRAAAIELAIVFPDYIFTQIPERGISLAPSALTAS